MSGGKGKVRPRVLDLEVYLSKHSEAPVYRGVVLTYDEEVFYRELKRELAPVARETVLTEAVVEFLVEKAAERSNSVVLKPQLVKIVLEEDI